MAIEIGRRQFISALGGAATAWPLVALAREPKPVPRVGVLTLGPGNSPIDEAFRQGLGDFGYVVGQNILLENKFAAGIADRLDQFAAELVAAKVDVILSSGSEATTAVRRQTNAIPIVMTSSNPVGLGFVASLARPGGNITGLSVFATGAAGSTNGIVFNAGNNLTVTDCIVQNFEGSGTTGNGILMQPTAGPVSFSITNTIVSNNSYVGIYYAPPNNLASASGVIDHVAATHNDHGIWINTASGGGPTSVAISNSTASNSQNFGINISNGSAALLVAIDNSSMSSNFEGIAASGTSNVILGRSVITANGFNGILNNTAPNSFYSYGDNRIDGNGSDAVTLLTHALKWEAILKHSAICSHKSVSCGQVVL